MNTDELSEKIVETLEVHFGNFTSAKLAIKLVKEILEENK